MAINMSEQVSDLIAKFYLKIVDAHATTLNESIVQQAHELLGQQPVRHSDILDVKRKFGAAIATAISYGASTEILKTMVEAYADTTIKHTYKMANDLLEGRVSGSENNHLLAELSGGLDVLTNLLASRGIGPEALEAGNGTERKALSPPERNTSSGKSRWADYLPRSRLKADTEYAGHPAVYLVDTLGYANPQAANVQIRKLRRENNGAGLLEKMSGDGDNAMFDFRGVAYQFIRGKNRDAKVAFYTEEEALQVVAGVLELEGMQSSHIDRDAKGLIAKFDKIITVEDLKVDGKYRGKILSDQFPEVAKAYYKI